MTRNDLDFENRRIRVEHQLCRQRDGTYYIGKPKTASGERYIPMTDEVYQSLKSMIANRPKVKVERIVDGYSGFLMLDKNGNPKVAQHIENEIRGGVNPKFCVKSISGANRAKFICCGSRLVRLPPCQQHNAGGGGCQGRRSRSFYP